MSEIPIVRQAQRDLELGRLALAVFDVLRDRLDVLEFRPVKLQELEALLERSRPQVVGALRELMSRGYLERGRLAWARGPRMYRLRYSRGKSLPTEEAVDGSTRPPDEADAGPAAHDDRARQARYGMLSRGVE